jgi:hypothetical protein
MTSSSLIFPSTEAECVSKLTAHELTPETEQIAFSTLALQAAQLIPPISYSFKFIYPSIG